MSICRRSPRSRHGRPARCLAILSWLRLFPTVAAAGLVILTGAIVREFGGGRFAQALAELAVLLAPFNLGLGSYLSMNSIEPLLWMGCALVLIRMIRTGNVRLWVWFGVLAGIELSRTSIRCSCLGSP